MGKKDPMAAAQWAQALPIVSGYLGVGLLHTVATEWAKKDVFAAIQWAQQLPPDKKQNEAFAGILLTWFEMDPVKDSQWIQDPLIKASAWIQNPLMMEGAPLWYAVAGYARNDPFAAVRWIQQLPEEMFGNTPKGDINHQCMFRTPSWIQQMPDGTPEKVERYRQFLLRFALEEWAQKDPLAAVQWAKQLPPNTENDAILFRSIQDWALDDPIAASPWAQQLPPEGRDRVLPIIVSGWVEKDPQAVLQWVQQIPAGELHDKALAYAIKSWSQIDPASAKAWVEQSSLPEPIKTQLLKR